MEVHSAVKSRIRHKFKHLGGNGFTCSDPKLDTHANVKREITRQSGSVHAAELVTLQSDR